MIEEGNYGIVFVEKGDLKGQLAYYDDDDYGDRIIVYPSTPCLTPYKVIRRGSARKATPEEVEQYNQQLPEDARGVQ